MNFITVSGLGFIIQKQLWVKEIKQAGGIRTPLPD